MKIIHITSPWCMSCIIMNQRMNDMKKEFKLDITSLDFDEDDIKEYNPGNILPVYILYDKNNQELERLIGEVSVQNLKEVFSKYETL